METIKGIDLSVISEKELKEALAKKQKDSAQERKTYKELVKETVPKVAQELIESSEKMSHVKAYVYTFLKDAMDMKAAVYDIKEDQASHTFSDGKYTITIGYRQTEGWDDTASAGVAKVKSSIAKLATDDSTAKLVDIVHKLLRKDAKGNLKANRVMELKNMESEMDDEFKDGVEIIINSYKPVRSCWFVEASVLNEVGKWISVPLSLSSVDFPEGFDTTNLI